VGQGTERLEEFLQAHFPDITIARIDSDTTRKKGALEELLQKSQNNEIQLLIGTQILAKGHHFPHLRLVAIVDADGGLFSVDFRAIERMAQLITQVGGRAGRVHEAGHVVVQTFHPEHALLKHMMQQNYVLLADELLNERQRCQLPPFTHLALLRASGRDAGLSENLLKEIQSALQSMQPDGVKILGPVPAPMLKRQGHFRYQLLIQSLSRKPLHQVLHTTTMLLEKSPSAKKIRWSLDVDPLEMF
jgi:primosomal protein N' (replication factor Y)